MSMKPLLYSQGAEPKRKSFFFQSRLEVEFEDESLVAPSGEIQYPSLNNVNRKAVDVKYPGNRRCLYLCSKPSYMLLSTELS